jgi:hypothetical protein
MPNPFMAILKKPGGATLLLALWLSIAPQARAEALESQSALHAANAFGQFLGAEQPAVAAAIEAHRDSGTNDGGADDALLPAQLTRAGGVEVSRICVLPPSAGSPAATSTEYFQARAPPRV